MAIEMVLVRHEHDRDVVETPGKHTPVHGIADNAVEVVFFYQPVDIQRGPDHVEAYPFRVPEGLFQAEEPAFAFETDLAGSTMQVRAPVLVHEIIGFFIPGKMDLMPLLLQVVPQMEGPRGVAKAFPADNKKEFHGIPAGMICSFRRSLDSWRFLSIGNGCLLRGFFHGFRDDDPGSEVYDDTGTERDQGNDNPDEPDEARVGIDMRGKPGADPANYPIFPGAVQPFHVHKMVV
jgi:hypothetical protein